jgi:hypothetical protein
MPPVPPKPQQVNLYNNGAIIAWLGTYPIGTTFNTYWEAGTINAAPSTPLAYRFSNNLKARTDSIRVGYGIDIISANTNIYVTVASVLNGIESDQSEPIFLSVCLGDSSDSVNIAKDEAGTKKSLKTDEKGRLIVVTEPDAPLIVEDLLNNFIWTTAGEIVYVKRLPGRSEPVTV